ncbi:MAG TPA: hypothetical protein IGR64_15490 [Leptolyngbyaceae cyanobacterium M65_K2018_010]|nr:hypothetical protein [Leptolyngbyaceae cyanobacterium M65_K2018_010]
MPAPLRLGASSTPRTARRVRRRPTLERRLAKYTPLIEVSARLAVNGLLSIAALGALGQLVPYIHTQAQRLEQVSQAVKAAEAANSQLKTEFGRNFDPAQAGRLMQEYSGYKTAQERQVVWIDPSRP